MVFRNLLHKTFLLKYPFTHRLAVQNYKDNSENSKLIIYKNIAIYFISTYKWAAYYMSFFILADYANAHKLEQDHPCVIKLIRQMYLDPPSPREVPYNFSQPFITDKYEEKVEAFKVLKNKVKNFLY